MVEGGGAQQDAGPHWDQQLFIKVGRDWVEMVVPKEENKMGLQVKEEKETRSEEKD